MQTVLEAAYDVIACGSGEGPWAVQIGSWNKQSIAASCWLLWSPEYSLLEGATTMPPHLRDRYGLFFSAASGWIT
eukprot:1150056-Pelagomonas_calceolata.AAC.3